MTPNKVEVIQCLVMNFFKCCPVNEMTSVDRVYIESAHGDVRYTCDQCDYKAIRKGDLKKHIDSVHRDVHYTCNQCDYKAKQKVNFNRHIDFVHGDVR